jgi:hypothetical protein
MNTETKTIVAPVYRKKITPEVFAPFPSVEPREIAWLGVVFGDLQAVEMGMGPYGPYVRMTGEFIAERKDGVSVTATSCFLPDVAMGAIMAHLGRLGIELKDVGKRLDTGRVIFGMEIGIEGRVMKGENDKTSSYTWVARPVAAAARSSVSLIKEALWGQEALPAPAVETPHNSETGEVSNHENVIEPEPAKGDKRKK